MTTDQIDFNIQALRRNYSEGRLTPEGVVREAYRRLQHYENPHVWTALVDQEVALASARDLGARDIGQLPLFGIPFSVKDNVDVAGMATTCGCSGFSSMPKISAVGVDRALRAGAILIGKNTLDQFATGLNGTRSLNGYCRNTFDPRYVPGGSSSGSGVAVAAGLVSFSLGSDTGGSGRVPAAMNNVVGVKPTLGLVSSRGMVYNNRFFDCMPVFARTVDDGYSVLDCIRGYDRHDSFSRPDADSISLAMPGKTVFRFALPRPEQLEFFGDIQAQAAFSKAVSQLEAIGGIPCEFDFSNFIEAAKLPFDSGLLAERTISYGHILASKPETVHPAVAAMLRKGLSYSAADVVQAIYQMRDLRREVEQQFASVDILVTPTVGRAYTCDELENNPIEFNHNIGYYTYAVSPLDLCALALPSSIRPDGIPFGIQLIALAGHDGALHEVGRRYQHLVKLPPGIEAKTLSNLPAPSHA